MNAYDENCLNELAGRIEAVGRAVFHLVAMLEDAGTIDGPALAEGLRTCLVPDDSDVLMNSAQRTLNRAANALDEARQWRKFKQQVNIPIKRAPAKRKTA